MASHKPMTLTTGAGNYEKIISQLLSLVIFPSIVIKAFYIVCQLREGGWQMLRIAKEGRGGCNRSRENPGIAKKGGVDLSQCTEANLK